MKLTINKSFNKILTLIFLQLLLSSCSLVYKTTGDVLIGFAENEAIPYALASSDVDLGCAISGAFTPFVLSFSRVTTSPHELATMMYLFAGNCAEIKAWEEELRYLRAIYFKNALEAQDARIAQKRFLNQAAKRQLAGYESLVKALGEPGGECPKFDSPNEEFYWLIGLLNGLQATLNDLASESSANVPLDIASKVGRGAVCLDNDKWWGVPKAIQAAIWATVPNNKPDNVDPIEELALAMQTGLRKGINVASVIAAQVHIGLGNIDQVKTIIRRHKEIKAQTLNTPEFRLLNEFSALQLQAISDRLWTEATGKRTPISGLGTFWDDHNDKIKTINIDDIL